MLLPSLKRKGGAFGKKKKREGPFAGDETGGGKRRGEGGTDGEKRGGEKKKREVKDPPTAAMVERFSPTSNLNEIDQEKKEGGRK